MTMPFAATFFAAAAPATTRAERTPVPPLQVHTLVTAHYHAGVAGLLAEPARAVLEQARARGICSVAELASACSLPIDRARELIARLYLGRQLDIHPDGDAAKSYIVLRQVLDGLQRL